MKGCTMFWYGNNESLGEIYRHESIFRTAILDKQYFEAAFKFKFHSDEDPQTKQPIDIEYSADAFKRVDGESASKALFKMAAHHKIAQTSNKVEMSKKYQVLCSQTAMIGVIK